VLTNYGIEAFPLLVDLNVWGAKLGPDRAYPASRLARIATFNERRSEIEGLFRNQEGLDDDVLEETLEYIDEFYECAHVVRSSRPPERSP